MIKTGGMDHSFEVVHGFAHESIEAKIDWFRTFTVEERMQNLSAMYELATALNPRLREGDDVSSADASIRVIESQKS